MSSGRRPCRHYTSALCVTQHLSQLYIVLWVHLMPVRLCKMGVRDDPLCTRCSRDHGDLIHLLLRWPKLHLYWAVADTITRSFQVTIPIDSRPCILGILDDIPIKEKPKQAIARAFFQVGKHILRHWKAVEPPTLKEWISQMGDTLSLEKYIFQHIGCSHKFNDMWDSWLNSPGLSPVDLVLDRLLM